MLNCPRCGVTNRPYDTDCVLCHRPVQDKAAAEARRREWDALPPELRAQQEQAFNRMREAVEAHLAWLRHHRKTHAVLGGSLFSFFFDFGFFFNRPWMLLPDLAVGAAAALVLNHLKGGSWQGAGVFMAAAIVALVLRLPVIDVESWLSGPWLMACFGFTVIVGVGYLMGTYLDFDHHDHNVVA